MIKEINVCLPKKWRLGPGVAAPDLASMKDFIRFYVATSKPKLSHKPTRDSIKTVVKWFFAGFERVTGTEINGDDKSEVLQRALCSLNERPRLTLASGCAGFSR
jgi:hypothetical protein